MVPFSIPGKWKWIQLGDIGRWKAGGTPSRSNSKYYENGTIPWLKTGDLTDGIIKSVEEYITEEAIENSSAHINPSGAVLIAMYGATIGKLGMLEFPCATNQACCACDVDVSVCDRWYLFYYLYSQRSNFISQGAGGAQPNISRTKIINHWMPLPPLEEQKRIVDVLHSLKPMIGAYEKEYKFLVSLETEFPHKLKSAILQEAIQGRLVPQLESEPAVEQIGKLIDTKPFPIPYKWKWAQLKNVTTKITDGTHHSPPSTDKGDFLYITAKNIKSNGIDLTNVTYVSEDIHEEIFKRCNPELGDVLFIKDGATTGVVTINNLENPFSLLSSVALLKVKREFLLPEFLVYVLRSQYTRDIVARQMQGTGIPRVTLKKLKELWIPIPPLDEQHRISQKLQNLITAISLF